MGIIIKQSIKGSIWSYLGVGIGFVTTAYLYPKFLEPDVIGLFGLLMAWSELLAQFSSLGINGVTSRLFPYFRNSEKDHNGYLFIGFLVIVIGFLIFLIGFSFLKPWLISSNSEKSILFVKYINFLVPLTFFSLIFSFLDIYNKLLYDAVLGVFLSELLQRVLIFLIIVAYALGWLNPNQLIVAFVIIVCLKALIIFIFLVIKGEVKLKPDMSFIDKQLKNEMLSVAIYSILAGIGANIVFRIDKIVINQMLGLSQTGIYTIALYFGTLVVIPSRILLKISGTLIAEAWKKNDVRYIDDIYKKSCLNQFIIAAFLFGGIWINIDNIITILGNEYNEGRWVIFFIGLGYVIQMATGANGHIIAYSKYYKLNLVFLLALVVLVLLLMYLFIPIWGITGAAIAIALSFLINNLLRFFFLLYKYKMQPFSYNFFIVFSLFCSAYFMSSLIPSMNLYIDILVRSVVFVIVYFIGLYYLPVSTDVDNLFKEVLRRIRIK